MKHALFLLSIALLTGCTDSQKKTEATSLPDTTHQTQVAASDTVDNGRKIIEDELIVEINDVVSEEIQAEYNLTQKLTDYSKRQVSLLQTYEKKYGAFINKYYPGAKIKSATVVSFVLRLSKSSPTILSNKEMSDNNILNVKNNFTVDRFPMDLLEKADCPATETVQWGVLRVSLMSKPNGTYKRCWVLDTGIDEQNDDLNIDKLSKSFIDGEPLTDYRGHGTHVAGIIGAKANKKKVIGVAPNAPIVALKVFPKVGGLNMEAYLNALQYVLTNIVDKEVVNLSINSTPGKISEEERLLNLIAKKAFIVIAAGNRGKDVDKEDLYPAKYNGKNIYTISSIDNTDSFFTSSAEPSNFGASVDYAAPGVKILSTWMGNSCGVATGTSQAAPHVAGILLLKQAIATDKYAKGDPDGKSDPIAHE